MYITSVSDAPTDIEVEINGNSVEDGPVVAALGDKVTCSAEGYPEPTLEVSIITSNGTETGEELTIKSTMVRFTTVIPDNLLTYNLHQFLMFND